MIAVYAFRALAVLLYAVTGASVGAATVFTYAGYVYHNTDPWLTGMVWATVTVYLLMCATTARVWR